jgi:hypothetical protein
MKCFKSQSLTWKRMLQLAFVCICFFNCITVSAQITAVNTIQDLSFGAFSQGSGGGTIVVSNKGIRSATGTVVPMNLGAAYYQAIFEVVAPHGTIISILNGPDTKLLGSNGGSMALHLGITDPQAPFNVSSQTGKTEIHIGATLTVDSIQANPPGSYSGSIFLTFNNE